MNVEQLATVEEKWLTRQRRLVGDREVLYERDGVYAAWRDVFGQYVTLAAKWRFGGPEARRVTSFGRNAR